MPSVIRCPVGGGVDQTVAEEDGMEKSRRPELGREAGAIEKGANLDGECVIVSFRPAILGRTVGAGWFDGVPAVL
jgi:hypothetical protein